MDDKGIFRPLSEMGIEEPGPTADSLSFDEINRVLSLLISDEKESQTLVSPVLAEKNTVDDGRNYYKRVSSNIMETKQKFLQIYENINKTIETLTTQIVVCAKARERQLKKELWEIGVKKVAKWDKQLSVCSDALKILENWEPSYWGGSAPSFFCDDFSKYLQFVDSWELKFDPGNYEKILEPLQSVGKIATQDDVNLEVCPSNSFVPKFTFGESGNQAGQFCRPWGVCSDETGRILVCDRSNHRIQIFNSCGEFLLEFGKEGAKPGEFNRPSGIDVDVRCRIIVSDKDNHRVQVFTYSGHHLFQFGSQGTGPGQFMYPWDVATNKKCQIAVSDSKNHRVQLFNEMGHFVDYFDAKKMGILGPRMALRFLDSPRGLAFRPDGKLLVTDFNNHRVLLINENFNEVHFMGREGNRPKEFFRPQGIACDKTGKFAVADCKNYRIQLFSDSGAFCKAFRGQGSGPGQLDCPQGICFHPNQDIVVVDFTNNRVQVF